MTEIEPLITNVKQSIIDLQDHLKLIESTMTSTEYKQFIVQHFNTTKKPNNTSHLLKALGILNNRKINITKKTRANSPLIKAAKSLGVLAGVLESSNSCSERDIIAAQLENLLCKARQ